MRILHVTDCFHGGVATAVDQYARLTPEYGHLLLSNNARSSAAPVARRPGVFDVDEELPASPRDAVAAVREAVRRHHPDVVHAHSSFAGAYVRAAALWDRLTPGRRSWPVVYTPHSYAFERADIPAWKRRVFRVMERVLTPLTTVGAPCAEWEAELMRGLTPRRIPGLVPGPVQRRWPGGRDRPDRLPVIVVPNALMDDYPAPEGSWAPVDPPTVGVVSRVTPQRDPRFFAETARLIRSRLPETRFVWIGDGDGKDADLVRVLTDAGIEVTGWLSGDELAARTAGLSLVIHTARWDGFPMAVLEVRRIGVPLLVRDIPALRECPATARFDSPEAAAEKAVGILTSGKDPAHWGSLDSAHAPSRQHSRLAQVYSLALTRLSGRKEHR
jgi:glycosyltransferase involved in cell wall biosynthesis